MARNSRAYSRGSLLLISGIFAISATIRIVTSASEALAVEKTEETQTVADNPGMPVEVMEEQVDDVPNLLESLLARERLVTEREERLENRMKALEFAESELQKRFDNLVDAERKLRDTIALADSAAEDDLVRLTSVYENMKAKNAAPLFEAMDPEFAAGFLGRMRPEAAANIMAGLNPEVAYSISVILAGRNANVPSR